jgi:hypothetical protein
LPDDRGLQRQQSGTVQKPAVRSGTFLTRRLEAFSVRTSPSGGASGAGSGKIDSLSPVHHIAGIDATTTNLGSTLLGHSATAPERLPAPLQSLPPPSHGCLAFRVKVEEADRLSARPCLSPRIAIERWSR